MENKASSYTSSKISNLTPKDITIEAINRIRLAERYLPKLILRNINRILNVLKLKKIYNRLTWKNCLTALKVEAFKA